MTIAALILRDADGNPVPQYYNPSTGLFEATQGASGSPNIQLTGAPLSTVVTLQNAAAATGAGTSMSVSQYGMALIAVSGTFVATITFQTLGPDGNTYPINAKNILTGAVSSTTSATGLYEVDARGLISVVANITAYTSGSVTVVGQAQAVAASGQQVEIASSSATGYQDLSVSSAATNLSVPLSSRQAIIYVEGGNIRARWDPDGVPTATDGMYYAAGSYVSLNNAVDCSNFKIILDASSTSATLRITYS